MRLTTSFTEALQISHPIASAPMGGSAGGLLAAAVSNAGGLGLVGGGGGDRDWLQRELDIVTSSTTRPWGIGFLSWAVDISTVEWAVARQPHALMLSFGDPAPLCSPVRAAGVPLLVQVTSLDEARRALDVGADVIIAQGSESGGHGGQRATLPFVPAVVDIAGDTPVLAAGGIGDGRGLAAALMLGASGALIGTRFQASREALVSKEISETLTRRSGGETERTRILDIARNSRWPAQYSARVVTNAFLEQWRGREAELAADSRARGAYVKALQQNDPDAVSIWAGEALDLITQLAPAARIVQKLVDEACLAIQRVQFSLVNP